MNTRTATNDTPNDPLLTPAQVAKICGVSHTTVQNWINKGQLAFVPMPSGRKKVRRSDLPKAQYADGRTTD
ncbi:helix-turn-helix domain-containing protein [Amycolatopsis sp. DSM 110486]|uniref:helix-turn-helix domain-containing protein n=1 Tax=Amycolatopsis sp. DSM 110486 TaxID=2865832 RepID=UPI001C697729|nr:helix-turn-helix domain-containing protein [Amycolatopsis sp. DSM 110486]QYN17466.1 helix-turn-helix domain-containing protein [Amycolatopsis sp. DSM 110486]